MKRKREPWYDKLLIVHPNDLHNNWGIEFSGLPKIVERFNEIARREFDGRYRDDPRWQEKKSWGAFWQGQDREWLYLEFWMEQTPENERRLRVKSAEIARELGVPLADRRDLMGH